MRSNASPLDTRKQRILKAIVQEHVGTAEPVGSEALVTNYDFGVRSATIRNEMAEMAEMGYLRQPHTSAGRVPSDLGYRFYVDRLMGTATLPRREAVVAKEQLSSLASEVDFIITQTCRILTGLTRYTSVATQPSTDNTRISHIGLSKVAGRKLLLVVALSDGRVEHRILDLRRQVSSSEVEKTANLLASKLVGQEIETIKTTGWTRGSLSADPVSDLIADVLGALQHVIDSLSRPDTDVCVEGANHILRQPEFKDVDRLEGVLELLEERRRLYQFLSRAILGADVMIIIGTENPFREMHDTSFVGAKYRIGSRVAGTIGVIGPTRMEYQRAVAAVDAMARNLSELLTLLSLS
ncbi:MAG: heat-inducible transcription repressor HrcA [Armatimonadetes bacterium]|nr:heat-inducible transcription repressor HrcA [Armatimonadota bacterium]